MELSLMDEHRAKGVLLGLIGGGLLWASWGNAFALLWPAKFGCDVRNPQGLHIDSLGRIVFTNPTCSGVVYQNAWLVFLSVSLIGLSLAGAGLYFLSNR